MKNLSENISETIRFISGLEWIHPKPLINISSRKIPYLIYSETLQKIPLWADFSKSALKTIFKIAFFYVGKIPNQLSV
jgi:hypothetical protein